MSYPNPTINMSNPNLDSHHTTQILQPQQNPSNTPDPQVPLRNLSLVQTSIDSLRTLLSQSITTNAPVTNDQLTAVSNQIFTVLHHTIVNAAALVPGVSVFPSATFDSFNNNPLAAVEDSDCEIVELDAMELLAEHLHFCEICGKGFKRDANLRMHMRAHGNQFKTPEALAKPLNMVRRPTQFSCPFEGCNRNKKHKKFKALKSVICVKTHFKRSHCPKMYSCNLCRKKNYSMLSDLKSHMRQCGESKWKCSCGSTFSRKDKLFGHVALFEGHMPAVVLEDEVKGKQVVAEENEDPMEMALSKDDEIGMDEEFFHDFGSIDNYCLDEVLGFRRS
ncbi:putative transcription factor C2H2 family [Medicago truncatula]|uniref:Putative transcription factor C2H2 family n=1 Tax=Medicago truncatula TaxID=3880 RepID=A0A396IUG6_MEDTR|nr:protein SENSITIVE TO PROTON RHIZOTOXICITY 1 [Medicago truncatula]RHN69369.1 putative transcription factor C2H2 family [Medicago truncatula]